MDFSDALRIMRAGGVVCREGWLPNGLTSGVMAPPAESGLMPFFAVRSREGRVIPWTPTQEELFATDWIQANGEVAGHG